MGVATRQLNLFGFLFAFVALLIAGCGSGKEAERDEEREAYVRTLQKYEAQFHPSDYEVAFMRSNREKKEAGEYRHADTAHTVIPDASEIVSGYRVQLVSTKDIDAANAKKSEVETAFPEEWFYLVYEAPTYKLRAGNFRARIEAERFLKQLAEKGFADAWAVPDKVLKNPLPRPITSPTEVAPPPR
jgi:hypothetical protein